LSSKVILIGTIHLYEESLPVLYNELKACAPNAVTVEISRFSVDFRKRREDRWKSILERRISVLPHEKRSNARLSLLKRQIAIPFEWRAATAYGNIHGVPVIPIDVEDLSRKELPAWEQDLLSRENLELITGEDIRSGVEEHFFRVKKEADNVLSNPSKIPRPIHPVSWLDDPFWKNREYILFRRLKLVYSLYRRVIHVCGWMHIVRQSPWKTLADLLAEDGIPVRIKRAF